MFDGDLLPPLILPSPSRPSLDLAPWHRDDPCPVINALFAANEAAPHLEALARFLLPRLTAWQLASSTIKGEGDRPFSGYFPLEQALRHQWWSPNTRGWRNVIVADVDHAGWRERLDRLIMRGLPRPAYVVASPWKGSAHIVWVMGQPLDNSDPGEVRLRKGIERGLDRELGADPQFRHRLTKNPWHRAPGPVEPTPDVPCGDAALWAAYVAAGHQLTYHTEVGDLRGVTATELLEPLLALAEERDEWLLSPRPCWNPAGATWCPGAVPVPGAQPNADPAKAFFGVVADAVRNARTAKAGAIRSIVDRVAATWRFTVSEPSRVEIVASIAAWMSTKWRGPLDGRPGEDGAVGRRPVNVGVMKGEAVDRGPIAMAEWCASTWTERRQAAGRRSAAQIQDENRQALRKARADLVIEGVRPTRAAVAERAGVSLSTAKRAWQHLGDEVAVLPTDGVTRSNLSCGDLPEVAPLSLPPPIEILPFPCPKVPTVAVYQEAAERMAKRGSEPEPVPPLPTGSAPELQGAHRLASVAYRMAVRRAEARASRAQALRRAADRDAWHVAHVNDGTAWQARLADLEASMAVAVEATLRRKGDLDIILMAHRSMQAAERRAHDRAHGIKPRGPRPRMKSLKQCTIPDLVDLAVPW